MKGLMRELAIPFHGSVETVRLFLSGSRVILRFIMRGVKRGFRLAWSVAREDAGGQPTSTQKDNGADSKKGSAGDQLESCLVAVLVILLAVGAVILLLIVVAYFGAPYIAPYAWWITGVVTLLWTVTAWVVAPARAVDATPNDHEKIPGEQDTKAPAERAQRALAIWIIRAVADAEDAELKGVHLVTMIERLKRTERGFEEWDVTRLRKWCEAAGIPTNKNLKVSGFGPTWGVRVDELQEVLGVPLQTLLREVSSALQQEAPGAPGAGGAEAPAQASETLPPDAPVDAPAGAPDSTPLAGLQSPLLETSPEGLTVRHLEAGDAV